MDLAPVERIADYAFLSDCRTSALVSRDGSIDWFCPGRFDAPSVFARLLDPYAGHWALRPAGSSTVSREYVSPGLVLRSEHRTPDGRVAVTDLLVQAGDTDGHSLGLDAPGILLRRVEGLEGQVPMEMHLLARPGYGLAGAGVRAIGSDRATLACGPVDLELRAPVALELEDGAVVARFSVSPTETLDFALVTSSRYGRPRAGPSDITTSLDVTIRAWRSWSDAHGRYRGVAREQVERSAAILQGLTYGPSGALLAAATTSLPERIGDTWNWDYRFAWLRDAGLMMRAQWVAACPDEPERFFAWLTRAIGSGRGAPTQIVFGVEGERLLHEAELPWLQGFRGSRPVRVGNGAWDQRQLDVTGEVLDIALLLRKQLGEIPEATRTMLVALADEAAERWHDRDSGMWEARDQERHYLSSKVMCWVALDRATQLGLGETSDRDRWAEQCDRIRRAVLEDGWSEKVGAYTGALGSDELDASVLLMPVVGFLGMGDQGMRATVRIIEKALAVDGLVRRWADDPNGFLVCSYWLVECLALGGEWPRARAIFDRVTSLANDVGLLTEMADLKTGELLGNVPQALSHAGLVNAAWRLTETATTRPTAPDLPHRG